MTSIALAVFIIGIIYVMIWSIRNDGARSIREQTGYIKMRVPPEADATEGGAAPPHPARTSAPRAPGADAAPAPGRPAPGKTRPLPPGRRPPGRFSS